ncbi:hypothetical protein ABZT03_42170 [Streptomyces sp. NPDC005574]|uniref:hypothetical protein n=1 Tax=Streptomyces sp. NPDC005574 TaxID=3156891 RepID=UPI0033B57712
MATMLSVRRVTLFGAGWKGLPGGGAGFGDGGDAEIDAAAACGESVDLSKFFFSASQTDLESFDLPEPALALGLVDPGDQVVADVRQP